MGIGAAFIYSRLQPATPKLPIIANVGDFTLTNQHGKSVTAADLRGGVWIANIVFTRCAGPCPVMTRVMKDLQSSVDPKVRLVTLTTDPEYDTPRVLKAYAGKYNADPNRWFFLTGSKDQVARLAIDGLKLVAQEKPAPERENPADLFIHSTLFVVVDKQGNLRASFDMEDPAFKTKIQAASRGLLKE